MENVNEQATLLALLDEIDTIIATDFITNEITALCCYIEIDAESLKDPKSNNWKHIQLLSFFREKHLNLLNELQQHCEAARQANPKTDLDNRTLATLSKIEKIDAEIQRCNDHIRKRSLEGMNRSIQELYKYTLKGSGGISNGWK